MRNNLLDFIAMAAWCIHQNLSGEFNFSSNLSHVTPTLRDIQMKLLLNLL
jgi:hypothetical protein